MNNFREVNDDLMKEWFQFREETKLCNLTEEDKKHFIHFEKISKNILNSIESLATQMRGHTSSLYSKNIKNIISSKKKSVQCSHKSLSVANTR